MSSTLQPVPTVTTWDSNWVPYASSLERSDPELWHQCYPRSYSDTSTWISPKCIATDIVSTVQRCFLPPETAESVSSANGRRQMAAICSEIVRLRVPLYFVTKDIATAIAATRLPQTVNLSTMPLPMESACFVLPSGVIGTDDGQVVPWIAYSRILPGIRTAGESEEFGVGRIKVDEGVGAFFTAAAMRHRPVHNYKQSRIVMYPFTMDKFTKDLDLGSNLTQMTNASGEWDKYSPALKLAMSNVAETAAHLAIGLLLLMTSRPDLVEAGHSTGTKFKRGTELWTPNIIGGRYQIKRSSSDSEPGSGFAKRSHWRRGHWRDQPYGPSSSLRKHIWLEPVWVEGGRESY